MAITDLEGRTYHSEMRVESGRIRAFVAATGDDPARWTQHAPPSFAAAVLFSVAPAFLWDPDVGEHSKILIHADQRFTFHRAWTMGDDLVTEGIVDRIRMRGEVAWVTFVAQARLADGAPVCDSTSLFLMSADEPPADDDPQNEPDPFEKGLDEAPHEAVLPHSGEPVAPLNKSASRSDLIRYAAASGDFNPLHWDHEVARAAGLPRVVCHGLLSAAWAIQQAARHAGGPFPISEVRLRFKQPLLAGEQAVVSGSVEAFDDSSSLATARLGVSVAVGARTVVEGAVDILP